MKSQQINNFFSENKLIIGAVIFFIILKFLLVFVLWEGRSVAPEPDDSYTYIANIASVSECNKIIFCHHPLVSLLDHSGFSYLSYRISFGILAKIISVSPETMYHLSFYIGSFILPFVLILFVGAFTKNKNLIALSIFFLAFLHGSGESHGFFWVVPSFFSLLTFFILTFYTLRGNIHAGILIPMLVFFFFLHPISIYLSIIFPFYFIIHSVLSRSIDTALFKRVLLICSVLAILSVSQTHYFKTTHSQESLSPNASITKAREILNDATNKQLENRAIEHYSVTANSNNFVEQKILTLHATYFKWLFPHWLFLVPFLVIFMVLIYKKEEVLISFYLSTLLFYFLSTFLNEFGFRAAIVLWPTTFLLFSFGTYHFSNIIKELPLRFLLKFFLQILLLLSVIVFFFLNILFGITINTNLNTRSNYKINDEYFDWFSTTVPKNESLNLNYILTRTSPGKIILENYQYLPIEKQPSYIITLSLSPTHPSAIIQLSKKVSLFLNLGDIIDQKVPVNDEPKGYNHIMKFEHINIYKK